MFDLIVKVSFDGVELFDGNFDRFEDRFFEFPDACSIETKIKMINDWAQLDGFDIEIKDKHDIQA